MTDWSLKVGDLKRYPHFDPDISTKQAIRIATDPIRVASHSFYPFIRFNKRWTRFSASGELGKPKEREIRYAARADAYIYSYYRYILSSYYEAQLRKLGLSDSILAYRRITDTDTGGGKCNIHFARDAFNCIRKFDNCCVIALDISKFFEHLDHKILKNVWCRLLDVKHLPDDHFRIFEAITRYSIVDKEALYERLGHFGIKRTTRKGRVIRGYLTPYKEIPRQLCTGKEFRERIAGGDGRPGLIELNHKPYGIPQGSPISDLAANFYLLDFDSKSHEICTSLGGKYLRYSDDTLMIVPQSSTIALNLEQEVRQLIRQFGGKIKIKEEKSSIIEYTSGLGRQHHNLIKGNIGKNGLEYLGFRYDGRSIFIRDSTLSNYMRKIARSSKRRAIQLSKRYADKGAEEIYLLSNVDKFIQSFSRVEDFGEKSEEYRNWTFWTYARRAAALFGKPGNAIVKQLRRHKSHIRHRALLEIEKAVGRRY